MGEKSLRRTAWFSLRVPLGVVCGGQKLVMPFLPLVLKGDLRAGGYEIA
jgi:hypothetical protein